MGTQEELHFFVENWFLHLRDIYIYIEGALWGYLGGFLTFRTMAIVQCVLYMYQCKIYGYVMELGLPYSGNLVWNLIGILANHEEISTTIYSTM